MEPLGTKLIDTLRLQLRKFKLGDAQMMFDNWANDPEVTKYLTWQPHDNVELTKSLLEDWLDLYVNKLYFNWVIEVKETKEIIGSISVTDIYSTMDHEKNSTTVEVGYCLGRAFWNKGYASEALEAVTKFLFECVEIDFIKAKYDARNPASGKVMKKCNFSELGTIHFRGVDMLEYGLSRKDFLKIKKK